ncbi:MAG: PKD domain-containing protein, partial [Bacteroidales bacterium]
LHVTTDSGCTGQFTDTIHILPLPDAVITHSAPCHSQPVHFQPGTSTIPVQSFFWKFYHGTTSPVASTLQAPSFTWQSPGNYAASLIVTGVNGCPATDSVTVMVAQKPQAIFATSPDPGCRSMPVTFTDQSIVATTWPTTERVWEFGDGSQVVSGYDSIQHHYLQAGTFQATLVVGSSLSGCSDTISGNVSIRELPVAKILTDAGCSGKPLALAEQSTVQGDTLISWVWHPDTLGPIATKNPVISIKDPGTYPVSLAVTSSSGCTDSVTQQLIIHPSPAPGFIMSPIFGHPPLLVNFQNTSSGADSYLWDFGDGIFSTLTNPSHSFTQKGVFSVSLTAFTNQGCQNLYSDDVFTVSPAIDVEVIRLDAVVNDNLLKLAVEFRNNSLVELQRVDLYAWIMGESPLMERWEAASPDNRLLPGYAQRYEFTAMLTVPDGSKTPGNSVCVRASIPDFPTDINPDNDSRCVAFNPAFAINDPFPNPTGNMASLDVIVEVPDIVSIDLLDVHGRQLEALFNDFLDTGLNRIQLPLATFVHAGTYILRVRHRDHLEYKMIILFK